MLLIKNNKAKWHPLQTRLLIITLIATFEIATVATSYGEIAGPISSAAGKIAIFKSDSPADWAVVPEIYATALYVDSDDQTLVFSSPTPGIVSIITATVDGSGATVSIHTFYNGITPPDGEEDYSPNPSPTPDSLEGIIKIEMEKIPNAEREKTRLILAGCFDIVSDGINRGTITTTAGARTTFKKTWQYNAANAGVNTVSTWEPLLSAISVKINNEDLSALNKDYKTISTILNPKEITTRRIPKP